MLSSPALRPEDRGLRRHAAKNLDNMPVHRRAALTAVQVVVPVEHGRLVSGRLQYLHVFAHQSGLHDKTLMLHLIGEAG